jgi:hypothetical protein
MPAVSFPDHTVVLPTFRPPAVASSSGVSANAGAEKTPVFANSKTKAAAEKAARQATAQSESQAARDKEALPNFTPSQVERAAVQARAAADEAAVQQKAAAAEKAAADKKAAAKKNAEKEKNAVQKAAADAFLRAAAEKAEKEKATAKKKADKAAEKVATDNAGALKAAVEEVEADESRAAQKAAAEEKDAADSAAAEKATPEDEANDQKSPEMPPWRQKRPSAETVVGETVQAPDGNAADKDCHEPFPMADSNGGGPVEEMLPLMCGAWKDGTGKRYLLRQEAGSATALNVILWQSDGNYKKHTGLLHIDYSSGAGRLAWGDSEDPKSNYIMMSYKGDSVVFDHKDEQPFTLERV